MSANKKRINRGATLSMLLEGVSQKKRRQIAEKLVEVGFFERRGSKESPTYWVPFLLSRCSSIWFGARAAVEERGGDGAHRPMSMSKNVVDLCADGARRRPALIGVERDQIVGLRESTRRDAGAVAAMRITRPWNQCMPALIRWTSSLSRCARRIRSRARTAERKAKSRHRGVVVGQVQHARGQVHEDHEVGGVGHDHHRVEAAHAGAARRYRDTTGAGKMRCEHNVETRSSCRSR